MNALTKNQPCETRTFPALLAENDFPVLSPAQQHAFDRLVTLTSATPIVVLAGARGAGRTSVLRTFAQQYGGCFISLKEIANAVKFSDPRLKDSEATEFIQRVAAEHDLVVLDNSSDTGMAFTGVRGDPDQGIGGAQFIGMIKSIVGAGKRLVMGDWEGAGMTCVHIEPFKPEDYTHLASNLLGKEAAAGIDFKMVYRYASLLNGHELRMACQLVAHLEAPSTQDFVDGVEAHVLATNIRIEEIEALSFDSLPGAEDITSRLETQVILPLEHRELAQRLGLKPKRGVLLYGPPGTGKTSIGRALAHRMKGKFFLIDGSIVTEPPGPFFSKLEAVIREAKESAPSVLFIDDADVLFDIVHISGLARYLLTLLDGLETESASHVCVMMTAMDVRKVPEALLRSGRVELWLETRAPVGNDRGRVLKRWLGTDLPEYESVDYQILSDTTEGFTPADLRRITGDAKCLFAADQVKGKATLNAHGYLERAIANLVAVRGRMADVLSDDSIRVGEQKSKPKYGLGMGGMAEMGVSCKTNGWA